MSNLLPEQSKLKNQNQDDSPYIIYEKELVNPAVFLDLIVHAEEFNTRDELLGITKTISQYVREAIMDFQSYWDSSSLVTDKPPTIAHCLHRYIQYFSGLEALVVTFKNRRESLAYNLKANELETILDKSKATADDKKFFAKGEIVVLEGLSSLLDEHLTLCKLQHRLFANSSFGVSASKWS